MRAKNKYSVYLCSKGFGCYSEREINHGLVGKTWAVSEKQACNNVRYQTRNHKNPHGGYSTLVVGDYMDEGENLYYYKAIMEEK